MNLRLIRRVALWLIATLTFAQASVVLAACSMDRGSMAPMLEMAEGCGSCTPQTDSDVAQSANRCVAHCTADLQLASATPVLVRAPAVAAVLHVAGFPDFAIRVDPGKAPPPRGVPPRILLHSFLI